MYYKMHRPRTGETWEGPGEATRDILLARGWVLDEEYPDPEPVVVEPEEKPDSSSMHVAAPGVFATTAVHLAELGDEPAPDNLDRLVKEIEEGQPGDAGHRPDQIVPRPAGLPEGTDEGDKPGWPRRKGKEKL